MKVFTSFYQVALLSAAALLLLITIVSATPFEALDTDGLDLIPAPSIPEGYTEGELHMTGTFADGIAINHTGTVEQIFAKLAVENPHINFTELALATPNVKPIEKVSYFLIVAYICCDMSISVCKRQKRILLTEIEIPPGKYQVRPQLHPRLRPKLVSRQGLGHHQRH